MRTRAFAGCLGAPRSRRALGALGALALAACGHGSAPRAPAPTLQPPAAPETEPSPAPTATPANGDASAPPAPPSTTPSASAPAAPPPPAAGVSPKKTARCQRDDQCALELDHGCCGDCQSVPFTAISPAANEKARKESDRQCAVMDVDCSKFRCTPVPSGCEARAVCRKGWCEVVTSKACEG